MWPVATIWLWIDYVDPMAHYPAVYPSQILFLKENTGYEIVVLYDGEQHLTVRPGSHVHRLITVLGLAGEYPVRSLGVLGNERTLRALVGKLSTTQELRNPDTDERMRVSR